MYVILFPTTTEYDSYTLRVKVFNTLPKCVTFDLRSPYFHTDSLNEARNDFKGAPKFFSWKEAMEYAKFLAYKNDAQIILYTTVHGEF